MAEMGKGTCYPTEQPEFHLQETGSRRRALIHASCTLVPTSVLLCIYVPANK